MVQKQANDLIGSITNWSKMQSGIEGLLLVGSYARGNPRPQSDIDLVILVKEKSSFLKNTEWIETFGESKISKKENWGAVEFIRVFYKTGYEVEFGFANSIWASIDPLDRGTQKVVSDAAKILWDPKNLLTNLLKAIEKT